jgi:acid phosphatase
MARKSGETLPYDSLLHLLMLEQDYTSVDRNPDVDVLTKQGILLTEYHAHTHPSQPNYLASVAGDYFGLNHDGLVRIPQNVSTVVDLFDTKDIDWRGYFEGIPGPGYMAEGSTPPGSLVYDYVRKHKLLVDAAQLLDFTDNV